MSTGIMVLAESCEMEIVVFVGCVGVFLPFQQIVLHLINSLREVEQTVFNRLHQASVLVNLALFAAFTVALTWFPQ